MSHINQPTSSQRKIPVSGDFTIRFAPGQPMTNQVFPDPYDIFEFIRTRLDSAITLYIDLTEWGPFYPAPSDIPYNFERVFLDGFFFPLEGGTIPVIQFPEGTIFTGNFLRMRDVNFEFLNTSQTIWEPTRFTRIETERAAGFIQSGSGYFLDNVNNVDNSLQYSGGPGTGTETPNGTPLFKLKAGDLFRVYADADTRFDTNSIEGPVGSTVDFRFWNLSQLRNQPNFLGTLIKTSFQQSGDTFPEQAYPGKLFHLTTDDLLYCRNADNTAWVAQAQHSEILESPGIVVNGLAGTFVQKINDVLNFISGDVYEITVSYIWGTNPDKTPFRSRLFIDGVAQGITTVVPNIFIHYDEVVKATDVTELVPGAGTSFQKPYTHTFRYTAGSTGSLPVVLDFGTKLNTGYMARALIRSRRLPV